MLLPAQFESYLPQEGADHVQVLARFYEPKLYEEPEELLMRAIFEDLINVLAGCAPNVIHDGRHDKTYAEAVRDILSDAVHPFTFCYLCQHFSIDIEAARKALLSRKPPSIRKSLNFASARGRQNWNRKLQDRIRARRAMGE